MERISGQSPDQRELAMQVLMWVTCANEPLFVEELQQALAVELDTRALDEENLPQIDDMISTCAGMVTVDEESRIIRLVHFTAQEFLYTTWERWFPGAETNITKVCATYLSFDEFRSGACTTKRAFRLRLTRYPFYDYAARNWGYHAQRSLKDCPDILDFLASREAVEASAQAIFVHETSSPFAKYSKFSCSKFTGLHLAAYFGAEALGRLIFDPTDLESRDSDGRTPLSWAAEMGQLAFARFLLSKEAVIETKDYDLRTPMALAARNGHIALVQLLVGSGADVDSQDDDGLTPLMHAAMGGHTAVVGQLLQEGAKVSLQDKAGWTAIHMATAAEELATVEELIKNGASLELRNSKGQTPLMLAVQCANIAVVEELLRSGANIHARDDTGRTTLSLSVTSWVNLQTSSGWHEQSCAGDSQGVPEALSALLERGADPNTEDSWGTLPLLEAVYNNCFAVVEALLDHGANTEAGSSGALLAATARRDAKIAALILSRGADINRQMPVTGETVLCYAARDGSMDCVSLFLSHPGVDPNLADTLGRTPLMNAAETGRDDIVEAILAHKKTQVDKKDHYRSTALSIASCQGYPNVVTLLLDTGAADVASRDHFGRTPLWWTKWHKAEKVRDLLLKHAEKLKVANCESDTPAEGFVIVESPTGKVCDVCTLYISEHVGYYHCDGCNGGDFDMCPGCYGLGARCLDESHTLTRVG